MLLALIFDSVQWLGPHVVYRTLNNGERTRTFPRYPYTIATLGSDFLRNPHNNQHPISSSFASMVKKTRRSHSRSRNGCTRCVQVSRKCDEVHPSCGRCTRLSFACDYRPRLIWKPANFDSPSENAGAPIPAALNQRQPNLNSPCQCEQRPTSEELFQLCKSLLYRRSFVLTHIFF